ncbi:MAG: hypothetical protein PWQ67_1333 [Clostridia bacterium]|nr:hypothetical protein [Clostridia bacterium]MDN5322879.1 hypothetical protein [Clostridia bacterium]
MANAVIAEVIPDSLASDLGLEPGDKILEVNGIQPLDLIHFQFLWADEEINLMIESKDKGKILFKIEKDIDENLGVIFEQAVFDKIRSCQNKCMFCFIEQMAPAMRSSLYVKDDDYRLSFLQGNFITLTNLKSSDLERIKKLHLSPLYVSVHTTDPQLRIQLLGNPKGGKILEQLNYLIEAGINIHTQVVLCPGINDGEYLDKTIEDLSTLWPGVSSLAIVPVGVTKFRKDLEKFPVFSQDYARKLISKISEKQKYFKEKFDYTFVFLADEIYIQARKDFPELEAYEDFPQTENGIGLSRLFIHDFEKVKNSLPSVVKENEFTVVTSQSGKYVLEPIIKELNKIKGLKLKLLVVNNQFFGPRVTVCGLLTGFDLLEGLKGSPPGSKVIISDIMLKQDDYLFLDGLRPDDISRQLNIDLIVVNNSVQSFINEIIK